MKRRKLLAIVLMATCFANPIGTCLHAAMHGAAYLGPLMQMFMGGGSLLGGGSNASGAIPSGS